MHACVIKQEKYIYPITTNPQKKCNKPQSKPVEIERPFRNEPYDKVLTYLAPA